MWDQSEGDPAHVDSSSRWTASFRRVSATAWTRRNAYERIPPVWWLVTDRSGAVIEGLRGFRVRTVVDVPDWGCLLVMLRGLRAGVLGVTDQGDILLVTPEDDEASWSVEPTVTGDSFRLTRVGVDGQQTTARWTAGGGLRWHRPAPLAEDSRSIRRVSWSAPGGTLEGLLSTPRGDGPFPLVVFLHDGPWFGLSIGDVGDSAFWASRGVALLQADYAGSGILGEEMMWEPLRAIGMPDRDLEADGVLAGVAHLVESGVADADRLFVYGFSYGGYLVNRLVTRQHPFAGAACWDGPADPRAFVGPAREAQIFFRGSTPEERPDLWDGASPASRPDTVGVGFTIVSGGKSPVRADSLAWHAALVEAGAQVELQTHPDEGHVFTPEAQRAALTALAQTWRLDTPTGS